MRGRYALLLLISIAALSFSVMPALADMIVDTAWVRTYNGPADSADWVLDLALDGSGGAYVTGISWNGTDYDYATMKYHPNGDTAWVRRFHGGLYDENCAIAVDAHDNVYVAGRIASGPYSDYLTVKYQPNGDTAWVRRYNGPGNSSDSPRGVEIDGSDNVCVTGYSVGSETGGDIATIKYHANGDTAWVRRYNGPANQDDGPIAFAADDSGNAYVTGASSGDFVTIKYYTNGDTAWARTYNGTGNSDDWANAIAVDKSGNVYVTGPSAGIDWDIATIKYFPDGDTAWVRRYNGPTNAYDASVAIAADDSGNVFVAGATVGDGYDLATIKYYPNGDTAWVRTYDGPGTGFEEFALAVSVDGYGNSYVSGYVSGAIGRDNVTIKYLPNGDTAWVRTLKGTGGGQEWLTEIALGHSGNVYVSAGAISDDFVTIKYIQLARGDVNQDGAITIADVIYLLNFLFKDGPAPDRPILGDTDCSGYITLSDAIFLLNYLFKGGSPPDC
jgi:hypothetical protein